MNDERAKNESGQKLPGRSWHRFGAERAFPAVADHLATGRARITRRMLLGGLTLLLGVAPV